MSFDVGDQVQVVVRGKIVQAENAEGEIKILIQNIDEDKIVTSKTENVTLLEDEPVVEKINAGYNTFGDSIL